MQLLVVLSQESVEHDFLTSGCGVMNITSESGVTFHIYRGRAPKSPPPTECNLNLDCRIRPWKSLTILYHDIIYPKKHYVLVCMTLQFTHFTCSAFYLMLV